MRDPVQDRWFKFVAALQAELMAHGRDPDILRVDSVHLKLYLPVGGGTDHTETFEAATVLAADPQELVARVYQRYEQAKKDEGRAPA